MSSDSRDQAILDAIRAWKGGKDANLDELIPQLYDELRRTAHTFFSGDSTGHTLQTTEIVNEAFLRMVESHGVNLESRAQFFAFAGALIRHVIVDYGRARGAQKRWGQSIKVALSEALEVPERQHLDIETVLGIHEALCRLEERDPRQARIVELRYFAGLSNEDIAEQLGISVATVKREWTVARKFLGREMGQERNY